MFGEIWRNLANKNEKIRAQFMHKKIMAKINIKLDTRRTGKDGNCPLRIFINHNYTSSTHDFGCAIHPSQWNSDKLCVTGKNAEAINRRIEATLYEWRNAAHEINSTHLSAKELKDAILAKLYPTETPRNTLLSAFNLFINRKNGRTKELYEYTLSRLQKYDKNFDEMLLDNVNTTYLDAFDRFLAKTSPSKNARNIHFRNIRAVFNYALDEQMTTHYPFRKFKIKAIETVKRSLTIDELRFFWNYDVEECKKKYHDLFKLIFLLIGINIIDLCALKKITKGRIEYHRAKTHKLYSIKVEPEAMAILKDYIDEDGNIDILRNIQNFKSLNKLINKNLRQIGPFQIVGIGGKKDRQPIFPTITTYWARHTWATIAAELDIPNETIAAALGHSYGNKTTNIYIRYNDKKIDEANRRVIDYVLYNKK